MRCKFAWRSPAYGEVQCWMDSGHRGRHAAWPSRKVRRRFPRGAAWVVVGVEHLLGASFNARWLA